MTSYPVGDIARISVAFTSSNVATDPTTVTLKIRYPGAPLLIYVYGSSSIAKDSTGNYHYDLTISVSGDHYYRWEGGGALVAADEGAFYAGPSYFS